MRHRGLLASTLLRVDVCTYSSTHRAGIFNQAAVDTSIDAHHKFDLISEVVLDANVPTTHGKRVGNTPTVGSRNRPTCCGFSVDI